MVTKLINFFNIGRVSNYPLYMVLPAIVVLLLLTIYPFVYLIYVSLHIWPISPTLPRIFLGLGQFTYLFQNPSFIVMQIFYLSLYIYEINNYINFTYEFYSQDTK